MDEIDCSVSFLGYSIPVPLIISCMTGGSEKGIQVNRDLACAAQETGIPVGMGSIRVLFENPGLLHSFNLKQYAPDVPVLANLGVVQVRDLDHKNIFKTVEKLQADCLVIHLNPGQELFQPGGDCDFRGLKEAVGHLCGTCPVPVVVKETGFGIRPAVVEELLQLGAAYIDIAGAGGTNWIAVESYRLRTGDRNTAALFDSWGIPTSLLLAALGEKENRVLASGGIRSGLDGAKSVALGARLAGMALPFVRAAAAGGKQGAIQLIEQYTKAFRAVMVLTGSKNLTDLRSGKIWFDPDFEASVLALRKADQSTN